MHFHHDCKHVHNLPKLENHLPMETKRTLVYIAGYLTRHEKPFPEKTNNIARYVCIPQA